MLFVKALKLDIVCHPVSMLRILYYWESTVPSEHRPLAFLVLAQPRLSAPCLSFLEQATLRIAIYQ